MKSTVGGIILVGGMGTRLRPMTLNCPKALMPVLNRPFLSYQLDMMKRAGISTVLLAANPLFKRWAPSLRKIAPKGLDLRFAFEPRPLGTGGAIRFGYEAFPKQTGADRFIVMNGDVLYDMDLSRFIAFHLRRQASCSIALTRVDDPSRFGVVETDARGRIRRFIEKPTHFRGAAFVNAGAYLFESDILKTIPFNQPVSVERETYPRWLRDRVPMFGYKTSGYWNDIGTPGTYLQAHCDLMRLKLFTGGANLRKRGRPLIGAGSRIARNTSFKNMVCIGRHVVVEPDCVIEDSIIFDGAHIGRGTTLTRAIVGRKSRIGASCTLKEGAVLGDNTKLSDHTRV